MYVNELHTTNEKPLGNEAINYDYGMSNETKAIFFRTCHKHGKLPNMDEESSELARHQALSLILTSNRGLVSGMATNYR